MSLPQMPPVLGNIINPVVQTVENSPLGQAVQGKWGNVIPALNQEFQKVGMEALPGETPQQQVDRMVQHVNFAGEMQDVPGVNPADFNTGTHFTQDAQGNFHVNSAPQTPSYAQDASAADAFTSQPGEPKTQIANEGSSWPQKPQKAAVTASQKSFKLPGSFDPIDETQASGATQNSKAYSVTTPDIQDAYRRNGITNPSQVYTTKQSLYDQIINPTLQADNTRLPLGEVGKSDGIIPQIIKEMQRMDPTLSDQDAMNAASPMISKISGLAQSESGDIQPGTIGLKNLLDYKTILNQSNAVKNLLNGQLPTTLPDMSTVATRNVLSGLINDYAPSGISQAVKDYGLLEEGFPSYLKAFTAEREPFSLTNTIVGKDLGKFVPPVVKVPLDLTANGVGKVAQNPAGRLALAAGAGAGLAYGLPKLMQQLNTNDEQQAAEKQTLPGSNIHTQSISQGVKPGIQSQPGRYSMTTPQQAGFLTTNDYAIQQNQLTQQVAQDKASSNTVAEAQDQGKLDQLNQSWNNQKPLRDAGTQLNVGLGAANGAFNVIQKADPSILNLNGTYDNLLKSTNPAYAQLGATLQNLQGLTGINFASAKTKDALIGMLDQAVNIMNNNYNGQVQQYFGGNTLNDTSTPSLSGLSPAPAVQSLPAQPPALGNTNTPNYQQMFGGSVPLPQ